MHACSAEESGSGSSITSGSGGSPLMSGDPSEIPINTTTDPRFSIEGEGDSLLIINEFAPELNGSVIYCRDEDMGDRVAFTLMSTRMIFLYSTFTFCLCVCITHSVFLRCLSVGHVS